MLMIHAFTSEHGLVCVFGRPLDIYRDAWSSAENTVSGLRLWSHLLRKPLYNEAPLLFQQLTIDATHNGQSIEWWKCTAGQTVRGIKLRVVRDTRAYAG